MTEKNTQLKRAGSKSDEAKLAKGPELVKGQSLWVDAFKRLLKNKAAVGGALVLIFMATAALSFPLLSAHVTHFEFDEQHPAAEPKKVGSRSVPAIHHSFDLESKSRFSELDVDDDGFDADDLVAAMERIEFDWIDTDGSGDLDAEELESKPLYLVENGAVTIERFDDDQSGTLSFEEAKNAQFVQLMYRGEASAWVRRYDTNNDDALSATEFPGLPVPEPHWFGADTLGRDLLTRCLQGARISLLVGFLATAVSLIIGVLWGATAGFVGGRVDNAMMRFVDIMYGLPFMFLVILLMVLFQEYSPEKKIFLLFIALGAVQWLTMSRIVRGQVISLKRREFVEAARATGVSGFRIITKHLIPNALGPIIVYSTLTVPAVMLEEAFLSFLGLGVQAPNASWGSLASSGAESFKEYPWMIIFPGAALAVTLLSLNFLGDGLRDALDPQTRKD